jgi:hypothetical protein
LSQPPAATKQEGQSNDGWKITTTTITISQEEERSREGKEDEERKKRISLMTSLIADGITNDMI